MRAETAGGRRRALRVCGILILAGVAALGVTRPHYGGTLRIQLLSPVSRLDGEDAERVLAAVGDTLPKLSAGTQHDAASRKWQFRLRPRVQFHDGTALTAADAVASLSASLRMAYPGIEVSGAGDTVHVDSAQPMPLLAEDLALPRHAIVKRPADNQLIGTGPFRLEKYEPGVKVTCAAFEDYWDGRPFLDSIEITGPQSNRAAADVVELPVNIPARQLPDRMKLMPSAPADLIAVIMPEVTTNVREAIVQALDRGPIVSVLTQKRGEAAYSLLPDWLSGYAFVFASKPDKEKARQAAAGAGNIVIAYDSSEPLARLIAERVVLNLREAGGNARLGGLAESSIRVGRIHLQTGDPRFALLDLARQFGLEQRPDPAGGPQSLYEAEQVMLREGPLVPVVFVPELFAAGARVRNWDAVERPRSRVWRLENAWVAP